MEILAVYLKKKTGSTVQSQRNTRLILPSRFVIFVNVGSSCCVSGDQFLIIWFVWSYWWAGFLVVIHLNLTARSPFGDLAIAKDKAPAQTNESWVSRSQETVRYLFFWIRIQVIKKTIIKRRISVTPTAKTVTMGVTMGESQDSPDTKIKCQ